MKKIFVLLMSLCLLGVAGCGETTEPANNPVPSRPEVSGEKEVKKHTAGEEVDLEGYNKVEEFSFDFDSDGEDDLLELFTSAEIVNGEIHKDDGSRWMVTVTTALGTYKIYDNYIQLGEIQLDIGEFYNQDADKMIILTKTTGAGKTITHFVYRDDVFIEETAYSTDDYSQNGSNIVKTIK